MDEFKSEAPNSLIYGYISFANIKKIITCGLNIILFLNSSETESIREQFFPEALVDSVEKLIDTTEQFVNEEILSYESYVKVINKGNVCLVEINKLKENMIKNFKENNHENKSVPKRLENYLDNYKLNRNTVESITIFKSHLVSLVQLDYDLSLIRFYCINQKILNFDNLQMEFPSINLNLHAEVKIMLFILKHFSSVLKKEAYLNSNPEVYGIGCAKLSCLFCQVFKITIQHKYHVLFDATGTHLKCYHWNFPHETEISKQEVSVYKRMIRLICKWLQTGELTGHTEKKECASRGTSFKDIHERSVPSLSPTKLISNVEEAI